MRRALIFALCIAPLASGCYDLDALLHDYQGPADGAVTDGGSAKRAAPDLVSADAAPASDVDSSTQVRDLAMSSPVADLSAPAPVADLSMSGPIADLSSPAPAADLSSLPAPIDLSPQPPSLDLYRF